MGSINTWKSGALALYRLSLLSLVLTFMMSAAQAVEDNENVTPTEWWLFSGQTAADLANIANTLNARVVDIKVDRLSPYPFTVTYVQNSGAYAKQWWWYDGIDGPTLAKHLSDNKARLTSFKAYDIGGGQIRFTVAMISNTGADAKAWWYYAGLTGADIAKLVQTNNARLTSLQSYERNGETLYAVIMIANTEADSKAWWWYPNVSADSIGKELSANKARPLDVTYAGNGNFNVVMESCSGGCPKWWWSVGQGGVQLLEQAQENNVRIITADPYPGCGGYCFASVMLSGSLGSQHGSIRPPPTTIAVTEARIGCLDIQHSGNLTGVVGKACDGKSSCTYKAPTEDEYRRLGVQAATRTFCTQGMQILYNCGTQQSRTINVDGDAWNHPAAELYCPKAAPEAVPPHAITVTKARIGCLDIQQGGNLTTLVGNACDYEASCDYKAPTEAEYKSAGVEAATRTLCTQGMEITYRCGTGPNQIASVPGDAWDHPPAHLQCLDIDPSTYRAKNGYDFENSDAFQKMVGGYNWDDMKELYGKCGVDIDVLGFCEIPDPLLAIYIPVLNASFQSGQCFGFSLSSLRFLNDQRSLNDFPRTVNPDDVWDLKGVEFTNGVNVSPNLSHYIHLQHALQTSAEAIHYYIERALGEHTHQMLQQDITNALNEHGGVLCMHNGGDGHCIVPYAVYPQSNGDYTIETYNPNVPYSPSEDHAASLSQSRITVHSANNTFQFGDGSEFSGGLDNIIFFPMSLFDSPSPPLGLGVLNVIFGGTQGPGIKTTQIADANGHVLLNPDGSWNTNPATRIPDSAALPIYGKATPGTSVFVLSSLGSYTQTIESHGAAEYQINLAGHDFGVQLHGVPSNAGDTETISYSPASNSFGFKTTATSKPFDVQILVRHPDKSVRTAHVIGTGFRETRLDMGFDAAKEAFTYQHAGGPAQLNVHLLHTQNNMTTEIAMPPMAVEHGDKVVFKPNWTALKSADPGTMQVIHATGASESQKLRIQ